MQPEGKKTRVVLLLLFWNNNVKDVEKIISLKIWTHGHISIP
jgi:hypothetical protein